MTTQNEPRSQVNVNTSGSATRSPSTLSYVRRVVALLFGILIILIGLRFLLLALAANAGNGLVDFIYNTSEPFVAVFRGVFTLEHFSPVGRSEIDVAALVAIVGYALLALLIVAVLRLGDREPTGA